MNDQGGHGGGYPPGAPPANELPSPGRPLRRRQVRTRMGGVGEVPQQLARAKQAALTARQGSSTQPPPPQIAPPVQSPEVREQAPAWEGGPGGVPRGIDSHHVLEAVKADAGGQGPGLVVVVTHASGRERTEVFRSTEVSIGRDRSNDLVLTGDGISRRHALLTLGEDNLCTIIDLGSTNGTFVNEGPIENSPTELTQKDFVTLGEFALRVRPFGEEANVDPSTMQFDVAAAAVIVQNAQAPSGPPAGATSPAPRPQAAPAVPAQRRAAAAPAAPAPAAPAPAAPAPAAPAPAAPAPEPQAAPAQPVAPAMPVNMQTAEISAEDFELDDDDQGTAAMLDTSLIEEAKKDLEAQQPIAPPLVTARRAPSAPPVRAPNAVEAEPLEIVNEHTVSEGRTRVKDIADLAIAASGQPSPAPPEPLAAVAPQPVAAKPPPGVLVTGAGAPPAGDPAPRRPRASPATGAALPQTGPRSKPVGEPDSKTPIGKPAPPQRVPGAAQPASSPRPARPGTVPGTAGIPIAAQRPPLSRPPPSRRTKPPGPRSKPPPPRSKPGSKPIPSRPPPRSKPPSAMGAGAPAAAVAPAAVVASAASGSAAPAAPASSAPAAEQRSRAQSRPASGQPASGQSAAASKPPAKAKSPAPGAADSRDESMGPDSVVIAGRVTTDSSAALEALLNDPDVTLVTVTVRRVDVERKGVASPHDGFDFASEDGLARAIDRICKRGGVALDTSVSETRGTLSDGWDLFIIRPPAAPNGHLVRLTRHGQPERTFEELTTAGWVSEPLAALLTRCVAARCNVLIVSERDDDAQTFAGALAGLSPAPPLWLVTDGQPAPKAQPTLTYDEARPADVLETCTELAVERITLPKLRTDAWLVTLRAIRRGREGVVARLNGPSVGDALDRSASGLAVSGGGTMSAFRAWLASSFSVAVQLGRTVDGPPRVLRVCELTGSGERDLFLYSPDPTPAGTFSKVEEPGELAGILATRGHK